MSFPRPRSPSLLLDLNHHLPQSAPHPESPAKAHPPMFSLNKSHPFYRPLWRRVLLTAFTGGWAVMELTYAQSPFWATIFGAIAIWFAWELLITYKEPAE